MTGKKEPTADGKKTKTVVADELNDLKRILNRVGGSQFDLWNNVLVNQVLTALWLANSSEERQRLLHGGERLQNW